jgi:hypothetical protein
MEQQLEHDQIQANIGKLMAETMKLNAEGEKYYAERVKLLAEGNKFARETTWYPLLALIGGATGLFGGLAAVLAIFLRH